MTVYNLKWSGRLLFLRHLIRNVLSGASIGSKYMPESGMVCYVVKQTLRVPIVSRYVRLQ